MGELGDKEGLGKTIMERKKKRGKLRKEGKIEERKYRKNWGTLNENEKMRLRNKGEARKKIKPGNEKKMNTDTKCIHTIK